MKITACGFTDVGKVRTNNEDSFASDEELGLFVVADGMGGHNAGEVASNRSVETIHNHMSKLSADPNKVVYGSVDKNLSPAGNHLVSAIRIANSVVYQSAQASPDKKGMGTTIAAVFYDRKKNLISRAHVGDSRIYSFSDGALRQITEDHTIVAEQLKLKIITQEEARVSKYQNILSRALGTSENTEIDAAEFPATDGLALLIASDGLTRMVPDEDIERILRILEKAPCEEVVKALIEAANAAGGRDNITAIMVKFSKESLLEKIFQ